MNEQFTEPSIIESEILQVATVASVPRETINFIDVGWDSRVYRVGDGEFYFKFPRSEKVKSRYTNEIAALQIAGREAVQVQAPTVAYCDSAYEYVGYAGVPGKPLNDIIDTLDSHEKARIGAKLGAFLRVLHDADAANIHRIVDIDAEIAQLERWSQPAIELVGDTYGGGLSKRFVRLVGKIWPRQLHELGSVPVVSRGDFHGGNILVGGNELGVIDFGDAGVYDESKDFVGLSDPIMFAACTAEYGGIELLLQKIALRRKLFQVIKVTAEYKKYGAKHVQAELNRLHHMLSQEPATEGSS